MPMLAGFHVEGNDHLILHALVAKILQVPEQEIEADFVDAPGRGWQFVLGFLGNALKRFYGKCAQFAVIGVDNDGDVDLDLDAVSEDHRHPRHSNHPGASAAGCRRCAMAKEVDRVRPQLNWVPRKPGAAWPIVIAVPVEMIETWLLMRQGDLGIQRRRRSIQKQRLYGKPAATRDDVLNIALPLIRLMTVDDMAALAQASPSFRDFHDQLMAARAIILGPAECW